MKLNMKWMLFFLFPLWAFAQNLKPGIYRDLNAKAPLVLGKGEYTFINLEMKNLGKGFWIDARKVKRLTLQGCRFEGNGKGVAVFSGNDVDAQHCLFIDLETGFQFSKNHSLASNPVAHINIRSCHFRGSERAIFLEKGKVAAEIHCNYFSPGTTKAATGVFLGNEIELQYGELGGSGNLSYSQPGGNIWPKMRDIFESPAGWVSLWNENKNQAITYYRYHQEFVGTVYPSNSTAEWRVVEGCFAPTPWYIREFCINRFPNNPDGFRQCILNPHEVPGIMPVILPDFCYAYDDPVLPRSESFEEMGDNYLGDPIPNPTKEITTIELNWPKEKGDLVIFELGTGKVVLRQMVTQGKQQATISVKYLSAGVYGYRLEGECPCPEPKRLIVIH